MDVNILYRVIFSSHGHLLSETKYNIQTLSFYFYLLLHDNPYCDYTIILYIYYL